MTTWAGHPPHKLLSCKMCSPWHYLLNPHFPCLVQWCRLFKAWFPKSTVTLFTYYSVDVLRCNPNCKIHSRKHLLIMVLLKSKLGWSKKQSKTKNEKRYSSKWRWCLIGWVTNSSLSIQFSRHRIIFHTSEDLSKVCLLLRYWNHVGTYVFSACVSI